MSPFSTNLPWIAVGVIAVALLAYLLFGRRSRPAAPASAEFASAQGAAPDPALAAFADADARGERPTGDQIARARLGGTRGAPELGQAPLVGQRREQTPRKVDKFDEGHVA